MLLKATKCPKCGSRRFAYIMYGLPSVNDVERGHDEDGNEVFLDKEGREVELAGCIVEPESPRYVCKDCRHRWR